MARDGSIAVWQMKAPKSVTVTMDRVFFRGPKPLAGREQIIIDPSAGWKFKYNNIPLWGSNLRLYNAYMALYASGSPFVYVRPEFGKYKLINRLGSINTTYRFATAVSKGALSCAIARTGTNILGAGDYFEINGRLHVIRSLGLNTSTNVDTWNFWPALRGSYAINSPIEIADPVCLVTIQPDSSAWEITTDNGIIAYQNVDFIEADWPSGTAYD